MSGRSISPAPKGSPRGSIPGCRPEAGPPSLPNAASVANQTCTSQGYSQSEYLEPFSPQISAQPSSQRSGLARQNPAHIHPAPHVPDTYPTSPKQERSQPEQ